MPAGEPAGEPVPVVFSDRVDPLQRALRERYAIEVPVMSGPSGRVLRVSAQLYNEPAQYERLAAALRELL